MPMRSRKLSIPVFKLYGEAHAWPTLDLVHCESIPQRSQLHGWEIHRHRHADLGQLLYVQHGTATMDVEGLVTKIGTPTIQVVPPMCVHGFQFSQDIEGYVITLAVPLVEWLQENLGGYHPALHRAGCYPVGNDKSFIDTLCNAIDREYVTPAPAREPLLRSLLSVLAVWLSRQALRQRAAEERPDRGHAYLSAFSRLVEAHYREHLPVSLYATRLKITTVRLNSICRRLLGQSALEVLHQRLLLEAKRNLVYTALSVAQIADLLGFSEAAYFTRFFKRLTGTTPKEFRRAE